MDSYRGYTMQEIDVLITLAEANRLNIQEYVKSFRDGYAAGVRALTNMLESQNAVEVEGDVEKGTEIDIRGDYSGSLFKQ